MIKDTHEQRGPRWNRLYETATTQEGHFTTAQAAQAGYSPQLLAKYLRNGQIVRVRRGVYRLVHFPPGDNEDLVILWLWSGRIGVFSHETALALHQLSDVLPSKVHLTVPSAWKRRRLHLPTGVALHFSNLSNDDCTWAGSVRVTSARRTVIDCAQAQISPDLLRQAINDGISQGLFTAEMVEAAVDHLQAFGTKDE
nr:type IV toxin-antitoxin system AbiEi family antitoxin domain-containing protein [Thermoanaerobaculales bacterium]